MPTEPGSSGQAGSSKRRREASPPPAAASSAQPGAPPKKRRRPGPKVPEAKKGRKKAHTYHMTTEQVPEGAKGLKRAVEVHARILGLALTNTSIPTAPSHHQVEQFEQRFTHSSNLDALLKGVRAQYNLPTDEELDELDDLDSEEDSDSTEVPPNARAGPSAQEGHSEQDEEDIQADLADDI
ncbi:hypothetical protein EYR40_004970 [Pleurotus pulmonarius]|nr:hypothetical protein EYR40_004970 [Pleurotus pulmonarius]